MVPGDCHVGALPLLAMTCLSFFPQKRYRAEGTGNNFCCTACELPPFPCLFPQYRIERTQEAERILTGFVTNCPQTPFTILFSSIESSGTQEAKRIRTSCIRIAVKRAVLQSEFFILLIAKNSPTESGWGVSFMCLLQCLKDYSWGPAATRALPSSLPVYLLKFLMKRPARSFAFSSQIAGSA